MRGLKKPNFCIGNVWIDRFQKRWNTIYWRTLLISSAPFLGYLFVFKNYTLIRAMSGLEQSHPPNFDILQNLEKVVFFCLPHQILSQNHNLFLDFLAAIPYLVHFPLPFIFAYYIYFHPRRSHQMPAVLWFAGWVNLVAVLIQLFFPTAPPWFTDTAVYSKDHTLVSVGNNEAGFERIDNFIGYKMFHSIYGASPIKFGAMPSLHVAWPAIILISKPWFSLRVGVVHVIWIVWAALYSNHHYGIDAIAGISLVIFINLCMVFIYCPFKPVSIFVREQDEDRLPT